MPTTTSDLFGHPRRLSFLFGTEMWERFSYYGMRALLVLYMVDHLLKPENADHVVGLATLRGVLEAVFGPLAIQPLASQIYGLYTALVYLTPVLGGFIADRLIGRTPTVAIGAALMVAGHFMMAFEPLFLFALVLLILGNGAFKANISTQVGELYATHDPRRDRAYAIFYVGINLGAFFSPLVCGTLGEELGWHYGFASAGVGMAIGLAIYLIGLPPRRDDVTSIPATERTPDGPPSVDGGSLRRALIGLLILFVPNAMFWAAYEQSGNTMALWAEQFTDRSVNLLVWHGAIPVTWFQSFNPLMIFLFTPPLIAFWARSGREPTTIGKLSLGCALLAAAYLIMACAAWRTAGQASWLWLLAYFAVLTIAELYVSPIGLSLISRIAPQGSGSTLMGLWLMTSFAGNFAAGWLGGLWSTWPTTHFFLLMAAIAAAAAAIIHLSRPALVPLLPAEGAKAVLTGGVPL